MTTTLECRSLPGGVVVEDPPYHYGVNGFCADISLICSLSITDLIALGFFFFFFSSPTHGLMTLLVVGVRVCVGLAACILIMQRPGVCSLYYVFS